MNFVALISTLIPAFCFFNCVYGAELKISTFAVSEGNGVEHAEVSEPLVAVTALPAIEPSVIPPSIPPPSVVILGRFYYENRFKYFKSPFIFVSLIELKYESNQNDIQNNVRFGLALQAEELGYLNKADRATRLHLIRRLKAQFEEAIKVPLQYCMFDSTINSMAADLILTFAVCEVHCFDYKKWNMDYEQVYSQSYIDFSCRSTVESFQKLCKKKSLKF